MNILIEFQDCSLEIGHIGTRIELFMEAVTEMATQILEGLHKIFDPLIKVISDLWDRFPTEMKKLAEERGGRGRSMTDANIPALLEELWEVDFETWKDIRFLLLNSMMFSEPREIPLEQHIYHDIIQGCIQRAIAARKWCGWVGNTEKVYFSEIQTKGAASRLENHEISFAQADTPAAAILAAYIEAVRASK